jgi:hypothetical protein
LFASTPKKCIVCIQAPIPRSIYCLRCQNIVTSTDHEKLPRRNAAIAAYIPSEDLFHCALFHVPLDLKDPYNPLYRNFVEIFPGRPKDQLMVSALGSMVKSDLTLEEILIVVPALADHHLKGTIFPHDIIPFAAWNREIPAKPRPIAPFTPHFKATAYTCEVCIRPRDAGAHYCPRCRKLIVMGHRWPKLDKRAGLKEYYDPVLDGFLCAYTSVLLEEVDFHDPYFLVYDHIIPGQKKLVPAAFWVNDSKGWLTADQFLKVIGEFTNHIRTGETFDTGVLTRAEWKRALYMKSVHGRRVC